MTRWPDTVFQTVGISFSLGLTHFTISVPCLDHGGQGCVLCLNFLFLLNREVLVSLIPGLFVLQNEAKEVWFLVH